MFRLFIGSTVLLVFTVWRRVVFHVSSFSVCMSLCVCVLAVYNKARAISNREFKLWTFLQGTDDDDRDVLRPLLFTW